MHFIPILSTLRRHKTAATLIVLEIAFTCAIVCNAVFLIKDRLARMDQPSGVVDNEIVSVNTLGIGTKTDARSLSEQDLIALRGIPGVRNASVTNMVPFGGSSWNTNVSTIGPEDVNSPNGAMYMGTPDLVKTFGVRIIAGRDLTAEEFVDFDAAQKKLVHIPTVLLSKDLATKLYGDPVKAVGQKAYVWDKEPQIVAGVYERLARPNDINGPSQNGYSMVLPVWTPYTLAHNYVLRVDPTRTQEVIGAIEGTLMKVDPARIILNKQTLVQTRANRFKQDRAMAWLLVGVSLALLIITALGVVGLASFWVQQRTRQIGIRRALGATRADIRRYFQLENFILATAGIVLGMAMAYGINLWLMHKYEVARLPAEFLPIGAALLWGLGQIAVLGPAMRAATIPPAIATRTV